MRYLAGFVVGWFGLHAAVVLLEPRGTHASQPETDLPETREVLAELIAYPDELMVEPDAYERLRARMVGEKAMPHAFSAMEDDGYCACGRWVRHPIHEAAEAKA